MGGYATVAKRIFAPAFQKAVYTLENAPKSVKLDKLKDILHLHWNNGTSEKKIANGLQEALKMFNEADHGIVARMGADAQNFNNGLSHDSAPLFLSLGRRWLKQGKAKFVTIDGEPVMVQLNTVPTKLTGEKPVWTQEYVDKLAQQIKEINDLQGTNFPLPRLIQEENTKIAKFKNNPSLYNWMLQRSPAFYTKVEIPNIGLLKFRNGGKSKLIPRKVTSRNKSKD